MTHAIPVTDADFDQVVLRSQRPVLVDSWATWCPPCRLMGPVVEELAREYSGQVTVAKLDVDRSPAVAQRYGIQGIPTLQLFDGGDPVKRLVGLQPRQHLDHLLDQTLAGRTERGAA